MEFEIGLAKKLLEADDLVAIPTETVYGLAANAFSVKGIRKIYEIKNRPISNPLIVHIKSIDDLENVAKDIPNEAYLLAKKYWPGPLTLVLNKKDVVPYEATAGGETVGVRVPNHKLTLSLLENINFPLVAPSANRSNHISPTHPKHVVDSLGDKAPFVLEGGDCKKGIESTIVGFEGDAVVLYRHGAISKAEIESYIGQELKEKTTSEKPLAPGSFLKHYSPDTKLYLSDDPLTFKEQFIDKKIGVLLLKDPRKRFSFPCVSLSKNGDLAEVSHNLYNALHRLDQMRLDVIIAQIAPNEDLGLSINDRLKRAATVV